MTCKDKANTAAHVSETWDHKADVLNEKMAHPTGFEPVTFAFGAHFFGVSFGFGMFPNIQFKEIVRLGIASFCFEQYNCVSHPVVAPWYPN